MANSSPFRTAVERCVQDSLGQEFQQLFARRTVILTTGREHEFDAVSEDGQVVAAILPGAIDSERRKIRDATTELYFLNLVSASTRLLVLTNQHLHSILARKLERHLTGEVELKVIPFSRQAILKQIEAIRSEVVRKQVEGITRQTLDEIYRWRGGRGLKGRRK